jgi:hypothetical protein
MRAAARYADRYPAASSAASRGSRRKGSAPRESVAVAFGHEPAGRRRERLQRTAQGADETRGAAAHARPEFAASR